jgi:hypothetical protein
MRPALYSLAKVVLGLFMLWAITDFLTVVVSLVSAAVR